MRRALGAVLLTTLVVGCSATPPTTAPPTTPPPTPQPTQPAPTVITISVDATRGITMPTKLTSGTYVFEVSSAAESSVTVLEPQEGYTPEELAHDYGPAESFEDHVARWGRFEAGTHARGGTWSAPDAPASFAVTLDAGDYWFVDLARTTGQDPLVDPANVLAVTVDGPPSGVDLPDADGVATVDEDDSWTLPETLPASGSLRVENPTSGGHHLVLEPVPDGATPQEWLDMTRRGRGIDCGCTGPGRVGGGATLVWIYDLEPGPYVVLDFATGPDGAHTYHGAGASLVTLS